VKKLFTVFCLLALAGFAILGTTSVARADAPSAGPSSHHLCSATPSGFAHCFAIKVDQGIAPLVVPSGLHPADLISAYKLPATGSTKTIAIVDAYNDPNAESDLAVYRSTFGLPPCTTANGCFRKVNQTGGTSYPPNNTGWSGEIALDIDMASAICPTCHILLVEANSASFANLGIAVNTAVTLGANVVSNSYGGSEFSTESSYASYYNHAGVIITASSGDSGYGTSVPAGYKTVVAVGGTTLTKNANVTRGWTETAWSGAGSGCSLYITKPTWQTDASCSRRTIADVSAVADPASGVSVYNTYGDSGWVVYGGTSASSPIIAATYALAGNASTINAASSLYSHSANLFDIVSGSNGSCGGTYLCTAKPGYDGPTGLGTPNGLAAF